METLDHMDMNEFSKKIAEGTYVLFFTADWCPDCNFIKPAMPEIESDFSQAKFIAINRDDNIELAADFGIMGIPSFVVMQDGQEKARLVNKKRKTKEEVENFLSGALQ